MAPGLMCRGQMIIHLLAMLRSNRGDIEAPTRAVQPGHAKPTTFLKKWLEKTAPTFTSGDPHHGISRHPF